MIVFGWAIIAALVAIGLLFLIAHWADTRAVWTGPRSRPLLYALSLGVYCTSWTFYGSVGLATTRGLDFLTIYIGPLLLFVLFLPLLIRVVRTAKQQNITSLADFMAARYGKNQGVAAAVTAICVVGALPYIALQLKAVSGSLVAILNSAGASGDAATAWLGDPSLAVALSLAVFSILFGTRHIDATEHQHGLMVAIAAESVVKLLAFLAVGLFVVFGLFDGPADLLRRAEAAGALAPMLRPPDGEAWITMIGLAFTAGLLLPRMFHAVVVENTSERDLRRAAWIFPAYLVAINLFVVPIALAGPTLLGAADGDTLVLTVPMAGGSPALAIVAFVGGLSAATAMVIVETVALSIMLGNEVIVPALLRRAATRGGGPPDMGRVVLAVRRASIAAVILLAFAYYKLAAANQQLAAIGLLSFAAAAQLAPAFLGGLLWRGGTARGAVSGMLAGFAVWIYTLLLPSFAQSGLVPAGLLEDGPFGIAALRPQSLFGVSFEPLAHGVFWSLLANVVAYLAVSLARAPTSIEELQARLFIERPPAAHAPRFRPWRGSVTVQELQDAVARYLGAERTLAAFQNAARTHGLSVAPHAAADVRLVKLAEHLLASAIGAASSRLVLSLLLRRRNVSTRAAMRLLDEASAALQYNRDLLQTALNEVGQGIAVVDRDRRLVTWNRRLPALLDLPPDLLQIGMPVDTLFAHLARRGEFGDGAVDALAREASAKLVDGESHRTRLERAGIILEARTTAMPGGGSVTTFSDATEAVRAAEALERANETLERRVRERTDQLVRLNEELARAKAEADEANLSKTRFLAAAGHDILQPLNAARLYVTSLVERAVPEEERRLAGNIDQSLDAVEEIIGTLLDISRLDAGAQRPEVTTFPIDDLLAQLEVEFAPSAREKQLRFSVVRCSLWVRTDRAMLRRMLQNLVSNAVKYTPEGRVLLGCRRAGRETVVAVHDTGIGIPRGKQQIIFREFHRLEQGARAARGLGLGLSIVERIGRVTGHAVRVTSEPGRGSTFSVALPVAAPGQRLRPVSASGRAAARLSGLTVLCLDNEQAVRDGMATLLRGWGMAVLLAGSAEEALATVRAAPGAPDVVLADYHLDQGDGLAAIATLRAAADAELAAVLITADRSPELREAARAAGVTLLNKPLKPAALRALLAQRRAQRAAAE